MISIKLLFVGLLVFGAIVVLPLFVTFSLTVPTRKKNTVFRDLEELLRIVSRRPKPPTRKIKN
jgi:hypothetical protein